MLRVKGHTGNIIGYESPLPHYLALSGFLARFFNPTGQLLAQ
ncbi:MAG: hypothetical protein ACFFC7_05780 [Candidatus Hermodarchaeota archaeon]